MTVRLSIANSAYTRSPVRASQARSHQLCSPCMRRWTRPSNSSNAPVCRFSQHPRRLETFICLPSKHAMHSTISGMPSKPWVMTPEPLGTINKSCKMLVGQMTNCSSAGRFTVLGVSRRQSGLTAELNIPLTCSVPSKCTTWRNKV